MASEQWAEAQRAIRATARRCGLRHLRDEIVDEAEFRLIAHVSRNGPVDSWVAYPAKIARSVARAFLRNEMLTLAEDVPARDGRRSFDELVAGECFPVETLRGATQRRLAAEVAAGAGHAEIAERLGMKETEVRRQLRRLEAIVVGRRKISARTSTA